MRDERLTVTELQREPESASEDAIMAALIRGLEHLAEWEGVDVAIRVQPAFPSDIMAAIRGVARGG